MNVKYEDFSPEDAAKIMHVHYTTVCGWCKNGVINFQDVSEPGSKKPRYLLTDFEVYRIRDLIQKYGTRKWMLYYDKSKKPSNDIPKEAAKETIMVETTKVEKPLDDDAILTTILRIRDLKERRENLEAELNQINNAIDLLKQKIMEAI